MKLCWIVVLVGISIILVFLYSLVAMSSRSERFIEQLMEEEGRKGTDVLRQYGLRPWVLL